jgi:hypothetical protein
MSRVFQREKNGAGKPCGPYWIDFKDAQGVRRRKKIGPSKRVAQEVLDGLLVASRGVSISALSMTPR